MPRPSSDGSILRYFRWFAYGIVVLLILVALAPTIIAKTALANVVIRSALGDAPVAVKVQTLSLGWFSTVAAEGVEVTDPAGKPLASIPKLTMDRTVASLLFGSKNLGVIRLERPTLDVVFSKNSSNLEALIADAGKSESTTTTTPSRSASKSQFSLEIDDGTVRIADEDQNKSWQLANVNVRLSHEANRNPPLKGSGTAAITGAAGEPGSLELQINAMLAKTPLGTITAKFKALPVGLIDPLIRRSQPSLTCGGSIQGEAVASYRVTPQNVPVFNVNTRFNSADLQLQGGPFEERVAIRKLDMRVISVEYTGNQVSINCDDVTCDLGRIHGNGKILVDQPLIASLSEPDASLKIDVDLAACAQRMPRTLGLHKDVQITAGVARFDASSKAAGTGAAWGGKLTTTEIRGSRGGKAVAWQDPLTLTFAIRQTPKAAFPEIDNLSCNSRFMTLLGKATSTTLNIRGDIDLGELSQSLSQFVDLGDWKIGGKIKGEFAVNEAYKGMAVYAVDGKLDQFEWGPWREPRLDLKGEAQVKTDGDLRRVEKNAYLRVMAGADLLDVMLRDPLTLSNQGQSGSVYVKLDGDMARWQQRLKLFAPALGDLAVAGNAKCEAWVNLLPKTIDLQPVVLSAKDSTLVLAGFKIQDANFAAQASVAAGLDRFTNPPKVAPAPLDVKAVTGKSSLTWKSLKGYGADVGPAAVKTNLKGGALSFEPIAASLNQGKLQLSPAIRLNPEPRELTIAGGPVIENAKITPEMCASVLGYALPLLANVAQAEGELSLQLTSARIPLADAAKSEVQGTLTMHHAKIGPSPLIAEVSSLIKTATPFSIIRENQIKFKVVKGRVYHEDLELQLPDNMVIRTTGSVGFDGSLDMILDMPVPVKLLGNLKIPVGLDRTRVRLPVSGTVDHPRVDSRALGDALRDATKDAAGNLIGGQLKKLFVPKN